MSVSDIAGDVSSKLAALRERFAARAADDLSELERQAELIHQGQAGSSVLLDVCARLHRLAGSAGTFGFPELGAAARSLEKMLKAGTGKDAQAPGSQVPLLAVEKLMALRTLLSSEPVPVSNDGLAQASAEVPEGSHGMRVRVATVSGLGSGFDELQQALTGYGFDCQSVSGSDADILATLEDDAHSPTVILCPAARAESLIALRDGRDEHPNRELPVVCLGDEGSFTSRYEAAGYGAEAFFCAPVDLPELTERIEHLALEGSAHEQGRVVLVEDDPELAEHYSLVLSSAGVDVCWVSDPMKLMAELAAFHPDILLMDVQLGNYSGVTLARMVRFDPQWLSLPIIYLSSEDNPDNQLEALSRGADEFLMKPVSDSFLVRSVLIRCDRARQLFRLMNLDSLTGLLKHSLIKQEVDKEMARCRRDGSQASVVMVDLDHFKQVNDTYGHRYGDVVIKALANMLRNRLRETDMIGRYGGEEFLVVLPGCDLTAASHLFSEIAESFAKLSFRRDDTTFQVTLSAGVAAIVHFATGDDAIEAADKALYQRKRTGRNGVTVYDDSL